MKDFSSDIEKALGELDAILPTKEVPEEREIVLEESEVTTDENGWSYQLKKFSDVFWKPKNVPDHLVMVYSDVPGTQEPVEDYVAPKKEIEQASFCLSAGLKVLTVGPTGCGKTLMWEYISNKLGRPHVRIEHNAFFSDEKVFGQTHINIDEDGKTSTDFVEGILPRAMRLPSIVNLDEASRNTSHANILYQRYLDRMELSLTEVKGGSGVLKAHPHHIVVSTDNTKGNGDDLDKYNASNVQDQAFTNRWDIVIESDYMSVSAERHMISKLSPDMNQDEVAKLANFSSQMHAGFKEGNISTSFSPRNLSAVARMWNSGMDVKDALRLNYVSRCCQDEVSDVNETIRSLWGS